MNLYFLVEGRQTEPRLYRRWIGHVLPGLREVETIAEMTGDTFYIVSGGGYPQVIERIRDSLLDVKAHPAIDHLFLCIDSEERGFQETLSEFSAELAHWEVATDVRRGNPSFTAHVIVQHCCAETWFLGHRTMMRKNPSSSTLLRFRDFYDVRENDPEGMGRMDGYITRASFHLAYLKAMLVEQSPTLHYSKTNPGTVLDRHYLDALRDRFTSTGHLASFGRLMSVWERLAAAPASTKLSSG